ncbi:MAG: DUF2167 domain-containing protein [Gammaproteobacteria bacterium]|jgi:uncharacterized membrane-anchored protein|nr:DUF2167 domain-containing protein [Gammaproteobacteria bacterium]
MYRRILVCLGALLAAFSVAAQEQEQITAEEFLASLNFQKGTITLPGGVASLTLPAGFHYLSPEDTESVLVTAWGNPPGNETLGMLLKGPEDILADESWAVVIAYEEDGYVSDENADSIDYAEMLSDMQESSRESNEARVEAGYDEVELVGWAATPRYDKAANKLYWAKELRFGSIDVNTLNYNVRILGRKGVLVLNLVATMPQLQEIETVIPTVLAMTNFNPGHRYADFDPGVDEVAAYGIGALVAGKIAAKAGLFAKLGVFLLALKKFWIFIIIGVAAFFARFFRRGRSKESPATS